MTGIPTKFLFDKIRIDPSDQATSSLKALSNHRRLRHIPSRLRVELKLVEPDLSVDEFSQYLLRQIRLCSQCWGWPPSSEALLAGSNAIMSHARSPLPLSSADLARRERELCADPAVKSRYTAYLDYVTRQQRWTAWQPKDFLGCVFLKLPNTHDVIFTTTWLTSEAFNEWSTGRGGLYLDSTLSTKYPWEIIYQDSLRSLKVLAEHKKADHRDQWPGHFNGPE